MGKIREAVLGGNDYHRGQVMGSLLRMRHEISALELAKVLYNECIAVKDDMPQLTVGLLSQERSTAYRNRTILCQLAMLIIALANKEQSDVSFCPVRLHLEGLVFPAAQCEGEKLLADMKKAMQDMSAITSGAAKGQELSWAQAWLSEMGIQETDPTMLALFGLYWMNYYIMLNDIIDDFLPI